MTTRGGRYTSNILIEVNDERGRQDFKWGPQSHDLDHWYTILGEEVGEVAMAILEGDDIENLRTELIQVAAVCVAIIEDLDDEF